MKRSQKKKPNYQMLERDLNGLRVNRSFLSSDSALSAPDFWKDEDVVCSVCKCNYRIRAIDRQQIHEVQKLSVNAVVNRCRDCHREYRRLRSILRPWHTKGSKGVDIGELNEIYKLAGDFMVYDKKMGKCISNKVGNMIKKKGAKQ